MKIFFPKEELKSRAGLRRQAGQMLIESVVAISLVVIGLLGILTLLSNSIAFNRNAANKLTATYLAAEGIEVMKSIADENYTQKKPWGTALPTGKYNVAHDTAIGGLITVSDIFGPPLLFNSGTGVYGYDSGTPTIFTRTVKILNSADNMETKVNSIVRWTDKGEVKEVDLEDHFFNWRP